MEYMEKFIIRFIDNFLHISIYDTKLYAEYNKTYSFVSLVLIEEKGQPAASLFVNSDYLIYILRQIKAESKRMELENEFLKKLQPQLWFEKKLFYFLPVYLTGSGSGLPFLFFSYPLKAATASAN